MLSISTSEFILQADNPDLLSYMAFLFIFTELYSVYIEGGQGVHGKLSKAKATLSFSVRLDDNGAQYSCKAIHQALSKPLITTISISVIGEYHYK